MYIQPSTPLPMKVSSIAEQLLFSTIRVEATSPNGDTGLGTSFVFTHNGEGGLFPVLVTNRHVIKGANTGTLTFHLGEGNQPYREGFVLRIGNFESIWFCHPDDAVDIAVTPLMPLLANITSKGVPIYYTTISDKELLTTDNLAEMDAIEEVIFIGYPNGLWDQVNLVPIIRKGTTATPIVLDFMGKPEFLIDASVFGGSSGSPVFLYNSSGIYYSRVRRSSMVGTRLHFLGILTASFFTRDFSRIEMKPIPSLMAPVAINEQMIDLGLVIKASLVVETIDLFLKSIKPSTER